MPIKQELKDGEAFYITKVDGFFQDKIKIKFIGNLNLIPEDKPFRGPKKYNEDSFEYANVFEGEIDNFFGEEIITSKDGKEIYKAKYIGGLIDQQKED